MKYYTRTITKREEINEKENGYVLYLEILKTNDINQYNRTKRTNFFRETDDITTRKILRSSEADTVYALKIHTLKTWLKK